MSLKLGTFVLLELPTGTEERKCLGGLINENSR